MSTCNLRLYIDTKLDEHKNYVIDDIEVYLTSKTYIDISNFQYQRFELYKTIKVNLSQDYQTKLTNINRYDYLRVSFTKSGETIYYYYYVVGINQKAESTIELELKMDVLNTFRFSTTASNSTYTLSNRSLITREHKDRWALYQYRNFSFTQVDRTELVDNTLYWIDVAKFKNDIPSETFHLNNSIFNLYVYDRQNNILFNSNDILNGEYVYYSFNIYQTSGNIYLIEFTNHDQTYTYSFSFNKQEAKLCVEFTSITYDYDETDDNGFDYIYGTELSRSRAIRKIQRMSEGIDTLLFKNNETTLYDDDGVNTWYVIYSSTNPVVSSSDATASKYVNPVNIILQSDLGYHKTTKVISEVEIVASQIPEYKNLREYLRITKADFTDANGYFKIGDTTYLASNMSDDDIYMVEKDKNSDLYFNRLVYYNDGWQEIQSDFASVSFYGIDSVPLWGGIYTNMITQLRYLETFYIGSGSSSSTTTNKGWNSMDLTNPLLIKAINVPYCPISYLVGKNDLENIPSNLSFITIDSNNLLKIKSTPSGVWGTLFKRYIHFDVNHPYNIMEKDLLNITLNSRKERDIEYESQLYHSDYYQAKFVYDTYSYPFYLENIDLTQYKTIFNGSNKFYCLYVVSSNLQSKFLFMFEPYYDRTTQDYEDVLIISRNNEKALFNNAFVNYVRSGGLSYDTKKNSSTNTMNGIYTGLSIVGAIASFASTPFTGGKGLIAGAGLASTAIGKITSSIHTAQEQDRAMSYKMNQLTLQGTTVSTADDVDLLRAYSNNKAKLCYYETSDIMKNALWNLFHYYGYKCQEYKVPNVNTRCNFNFVQGEIVLDQYNFNEDIANEIINKWKDGITFFHYNLIAGYDSYDIEQQYENFEVSLL